MIPQCETEMDYLSGTDIKELNASLDRYAAIDSMELSEQSHGFAWDQTPRDREMDAANIMREAGASDDMIGHVSEMLTFENCLNNGVSASR